MIIKLISIRNLMLAPVNSAHTRTVSVEGVSFRQNVCVCVFIDSFEGVIAIVSSTWWWENGTGTKKIVFSFG